MKLYYKKRIIHILNHKGGSAFLDDLTQLLCSPRRSFFNDAFCSLSDHQFYSYVFELCMDNTTDMADFSEHPSLRTLGSFRRHYSSSEERKSLIILSDGVRNLSRGEKAEGEAVAAQGAGNGAGFRTETPGEGRPGADRAGEAGNEEEGIRDRRRPRTAGPSPVFKRRMVLVLSVIHDRGLHTNPAVAAAMGSSRRQTRRYLNELVDRGYLSENNEWYFVTEKGQKAFQRWTGMGALPLASREANGRGPAQY